LLSIAAGNLTTLYAAKYFCINRAKAFRFSGETPAYSMMQGMMSSCSSFFRFPLDTLL